MSLSAPLLQIMALILLLLVGSVLPIPGLANVLAQIRLLLVMVLGVATLYLGLTMRKEELQPLEVGQTDEVLHEVERGS